MPVSPAPVSRPHESVVGLALRCLSDLPFWLLSLLLAACGGEAAAPSTTSALGSTAPPAPTSRPAAASCVADAAAHAAAQASALYDDELDREQATVAPFRPSASGRDPSPPADLDGDGQPEIDVTFSAHYGAYSRRHWIYGAAGGCLRALGAFDESYVWVGPERHGGVSDLLVLVSGIDDAMGHGEGVMTRLEFDAATGYAGRETLRCGSLADPPSPRDERCPGTWGRPGRWQQTGAWRDLAPPRTFMPERCLVPAEDAARQMDDPQPSRTVLPDLDGDGEADLALSGELACGSGGCEEHIYLSHQGCPQYAGSLFGTIEHDAARRELRTFEGQGVCDGGGSRGVAVVHRLEGTRLREARRVDCPCRTEGARPPECG